MAQLLNGRGNSLDEQSFHALRAHSEVFNHRVFVFFWLIPPHDALKQHNKKAYQILTSCIEVCDLFINVPYVPCFSAEQGTNPKLLRIIDAMSELVNAIISGEKKDGNDFWSEFEDVKYCAMGIILEASACLCQLSLPLHRGTCKYGTEKYPGVCDCLSSNELFEYSIKISNIISHSIPIDTTTFFTTDSNREKVLGELKELVKSMLSLLKFDHHKIEKNTRAYQPGVYGIDEYQSHTLGSIVVIGNVLWNVLPYSRTMLTVHRPPKTVNGKSVQQDPYQVETELLLCPTTEAFNIAYAKLVKHCGGIAGIEYSPQARALMEHTHTQGYIESATASSSHQSGGRGVVKCRRRYCRHHLSRYRRGWS